MLLPSPVYYDDALSNVINLFLVLDIYVLLVLCYSTDCAG